MFRPLAQVMNISLSNDIKMSVVKLKISVKEKSIVFVAANRGKKPLLVTYYGNKLQVL